MDEERMNKLLKMYVQRLQSEYENTVQINDYFNRYGVRSGEIELPAGATVADLLKSLGIPLSK